MKNYDLKKLIQTTAALGSLIAMSGAAAQAQIIYFDPSGDVTQVSSPVLTAPYSLGDANLNVPSPYVTSAGATGVTFVALATGQPVGTTPAFEASLSDNTVDFAATGIHLLNTFNGDAGVTTAVPTGPLEIDFSSPVGAFGLRTQSAANDTYTFTYDIYNGSTLLGSYTTPTVDNLIADDGFTGKSVFLGAESTTGADITKVVISSFSTASDPSTGIFNYTGNSNDFLFGPLAVGAPVPEASTFTGFGISILLFGGLCWVSRKRKTKLSQASG